MSQALEQTLRVVLADTYALALKTQNYHWNVEGPHFRSLHLLFEEQYTELHAAVDVIAERLRTLGAKAPGSFAAFSDDKTIDEAIDGASDHDMVDDLFRSNRQLVKSIRKALDAAQEVDDEFTADLLIGRTGAHEKAAWMLRSSLPAAIRKDEADAASY